MVMPASFPSLERYDESCRSENRKQLSEDQWFLIRELFPWKPPSSVGGRSPVPPRAALEALLWLLRNGGRWQDVPDWAPSESTCRRRLAEWAQSGVLREAWSLLVKLTTELGEIDWEHLIADGTFCRAKKGGISWNEATRAKARRLSSSWTAIARPSAW